MLEKEIRNLFSEYPDIIYGFTDISYCSYKESYRSALVLAVPYGEQLTHDDYTEERFEQGIQAAKGRLETVVAGIEQILQKHQVKYWIPKQNSGPCFPLKRPRPMPESDGSGRMMSSLPKNTAPGSGYQPF